MESIILTVLSLAAGAALLQRAPADVISAGPEVSLVSLDDGERGGTIFGENREFVDEELLSLWGGRVSARVAPRWSIETGFVQGGTRARLRSLATTGTQGIESSFDVDLRSVWGGLVHHRRIHESLELAFAGGLGMIRSSSDGFVESRVLPGERQERALTLADVVFSAGEPVLDLTARASAGVELDMGRDVLLRADVHDVIHFCREERDSSLLHGFACSGERNVALHHIGATIGVRYRF